MMPLRSTPRRSFARVSRALVFMGLLAAGCSDSDEPLTRERLIAEAEAFAEEERRELAGRRSAAPSGSGPAHPPIPEATLYRNGAMTDAEEDAYLEALDDTDHEEEYRQALERGEISGPPLPHSNSSPAVDDEAEWTTDPVNRLAKVIGGARAVEAALVYPPKARRLGYEGTVVVIVGVDRAGRPIRTGITMSTPDYGTDAHAVLTEAATNLALDLRYEPSKRYDESVQLLTVVFDLDR